MLQVLLAVLALSAGALAPARAGAATLYVTNTKSDTISVIDTDTFEVVRTIPLGRGETPARQVGTKPP